MVAFFRKTRQAVSGGWVCPAAGGSTCRTGSGMVLHSFSVRSAHWVCSDEAPDAGPVPDATVVITWPSGSSASQSTSFSLGCPLYSPSFQSASTHCPGISPSFRPTPVPYGKGLRVVVGVGVGDTLTFGCCLVSV